MNFATAGMSGATIVRDAQAWDAAVLAHPRASFLQSYAWGRFKQHFGWAPVRLCLSAKRGKPTPLVQALFRRIPYSPYTLGYIPRGPLMEYEDEDAIDGMERVLDHLARRYRAVAITLELPTLDNDLLTARLLRRRMRPTRPIQTLTTRVLDLTPMPEAIMASWKPKWRSNTRLAIKHGVQVRAATDVEDLARWYALYEVTSKRDTFTIRGEAYYRRFWQENYQKGDTALLLAEHEGRLLAGIMVHRFGPDATYLYGAFDHERRSLMPNNLLQWEAIQWARAHGAVRYDLWGIAATDNPEEPLAGVSRFKAGFGGQVVRYGGAFDRVYHPALYAALRRVRERGAGSQQ